MPDIIAYGLTQAGTQRRINEDGFFIQGKLYPDTLDAKESHFASTRDFWQIYAVADGLGGPGVGDIATRYVLGSLRDFLVSLPTFDPDDFDFASAIQSFADTTDQGLRERLHRYQDRPAGCSLALLLFSGQTGYCMSIGSCRIYMVRQHRLYQMTKDQRLQEDADERPLLFFGNHPGVMRLKVQNLYTLDLQEGDTFLIMSDGLSSAVNERAIRLAVNGNVLFEEKLSALFEFGRQLNPADNASLLGICLETRPDDGTLVYHGSTERPLQPGQAHRMGVRDQRMGAGDPGMGSQTKRMPTVNQRELMNTQAFQTAFGVPTMFQTQQLPPQEELNFQFDPGPGQNQALSRQKKETWFRLVLDILRDHAGMTLLFILIFLLLLLILLLL